MEAQQRMAMMQAGMMGMAHPAMQQQMVMQQQMAMMQHMAMGRPWGPAMPFPGMMPGMGVPPFGGFARHPKRKRTKERQKDGRAAGPRRAAEPAAALAPAPGGSSRSAWSSSSSSEDSDGNAEVAGMMAPGAWPGVAAWPPALGARAVEAFLAQCTIDPDAADKLRALPPHLQYAVIDRGPVSSTRNPSAVLIARIRDVELGTGSASSAGRGYAAAFAEGISSPPLGDFHEAHTPRKSAKATVEAMIADYRLSPGCAWMLRALSPELLKIAARIDPSGQADPSAYVLEQMSRYL